MNLLPENADLYTSFSQDEDPAFLSEQIITYIGNKRALLQFIQLGVEIACQRLGKNKLRIGDLFSGSGIVARFLKKYADHLLVNDQEVYSRILNQCYLCNKEKAEELELLRHHRRLMRYLEEHLSPGIITELYAPKDSDAIAPGERVFYTTRNAIYLDSARSTIELLPEEIRPFFIAPLLAEASVHANTSGVFKGFYKNADGVGQFGGRGRNALYRIMGDISLPFPLFSQFSCSSEIYCCDANELVTKIPELDLIYLDPPYNQHPYGSNYFMLNILATYQKPREISLISGIPTDWNRSDYNNKRKAAEALFGLLQACPARFLLLSYSSEGFIQYDEMIDYLNSLGKVDVLETSYATFRGCRNLKDRAQAVTEFLFLVDRQYH